MKPLMRVEVRVSQEGYDDYGGAFEIEVPAQPVLLGAMLCSLQQSIIQSLQDQDRLASVEA